MSVCDEDWPAVWNGDASEPDFCPCAMTYGGCGGRVIGCTLGVWHEWLAVETANLPPATCEFVPTLKAFLKGDYAIFGQDDGMGYSVHIDQGYEH